MKNWTLGKKIIFNYVIVLAVIALVGVFIYARLLAVNQQATRVSADCLPGLTIVGDIANQARDNYAILLQYLTSTNADERTAMEAQMAKISAANDLAMTNYEATITTSRDRELFNAIAPAREVYREARKQLLALNQAGKTDEATALLHNQVNPAFAKYMGAVNAEFDFNQQNGADAGKQITAAVAGMKAATLFGLGIALILGTVIAFTNVQGINRILRSLTSSLDNSSNEVSSAASQVSAASQSLAEGSSEQAASLEETSASLEEMSSMTRQNAENTQKANDLAKQARQAADKGVIDMQSMNTAMEAIKNSSDDIAKIIKTIDEIAFQTNILALNAAVEAARAGEAGMGFAVVADEVRNLAQRSAQAAKETAAKIEGAIAKTAQGVEISGKVAQTLNEIVTKARQVDELVAEVSSASREQSQGISQVNTAVGQMDKVTQSNAANAEESAAAAEELSAQAQAMKESVAELLQLVGGGQNVGTEAGQMDDHQPEVSTPHHSRLFAGNGHSSSALAPARKLNCWEFKKCGREAGGVKARELGVCPAYPDHGHGCASLAGTLCGGKVQGSFAQKLSSCLKCNFYNSPNYGQKSETTHAASVIPMPGDHGVSARNNLITWDGAQMSTGVESVDSQHRELIQRINQLHAACVAGTAREELLKLLDFLGGYAQSHFRHEEEVMQDHRCPARGQNKAAHVQFLGDYERLVEIVKRDGPSTTAVLQIKELLGNWLKNHICAIDTKLRTCAGNGARSCRTAAAPGDRDFRDF